LQDAGLFSLKEVGMGQHFFCLPTADVSLFLVLTIQVLGYPILTPYPSGVFPENNSPAKHESPGDQKKMLDLWKAGCGGEHPSVELVENRIYIYMYITRFIIIIIIIYIYICICIIIYYIYTLYIYIYDTRTHTHIHVYMVYNTLCKYIILLHICNLICNYIYMYVYICIYISEYKNDSCLSFSTILTVGMWIFNEVGTRWMALCIIPGISEIAFISGSRIQGILWNCNPGGAAWHFIECNLQGPLLLG